VRDIFNTASQSAQYMAQLVGVRPSTDNAVLRASKLRGGHRFHRLRELLRIFDRPDTATDI
jgi:hypothetical protein